jgi:anti-sigma factor (TIGR02949 family)
VNDEVEPKPEGMEAEAHESKRVCVGVDYYSCEEAIKRLNEYLDHELTEEERTVVVKHLEICKPCFSRFTFEQNLIVSIRQKICGLSAPQNVKDKLKGLLRPPPKE